MRTLRTDIPDRWLRNGFAGGPDTVDYTNRDQVAHSSPKDFAEDAKRVIRFGGLTDKRANPQDVIKSSLDGSSWRITTIREARSAAEGKRQADAVLRTKSKPMVEYDVWATIQ